jgi:hypothetical protein
MDAAEQFLSHINKTGMFYTSVGRGDHGSFILRASDIEDAEERRRLCDTMLPGYGNAGHRFGDGLSDAEVEVLLEFLKTL